QEHKRNNVCYSLDSHANLAEYLPSCTKENIAAIIFNLGYLPKSDKKVITKPAFTKKAITQFLPYIKKVGRIVLIIYHAHSGEENEKDAVLNLAAELDQKQYQVLQYQFINQQNTPPFVVAIERK